MSETPRLSVIVIAYGMARELPRTVLSAQSPYQREIAAGTCELIVVDNGTVPPWSEERLPGARVVCPPEISPSPAPAVNWAVEHVARADHILIAIDGARIFSDRLLAGVLEVFQHLPRAFVHTPGWHLGPQVQMVSTQRGYDAMVEDQLMMDSGWPQRPQGLFTISTLAGSSRAGVLQPIYESNAFALHRDDWQRLGGYDERFVSPGGGLCNLELFGRCVADTGTVNVALLGEGTFHQVHGGVATSGPEGTWQTLQDEHQRIFGEAYRPAEYRTFFWGWPRPELQRFLMPEAQRGGQD